MSPSKHREPSIDQTSEYDEFISRLKDYHDKRGTLLEIEPKVGNRRVDLLRLYKRVVEDGGYDAVSNNRQNKLAWRKIGQDFHLASYNLPTLAFTLKTIYYKNLAAFEISEVHKKEPPPKEILEDVSAKGGDLLNRTLENFHRPLARDEMLVNGADQQDGHDSDKPGSPKDENKMDLDEPASGRATRGLRHAPPQRQLYQSDITSKPAKLPGAASSSPAPLQQPPVINGFATPSLPQSAPQALANYEPKPPIPLNLRPVTTPGNNYDLFKTEQKRQRDASLARMSRLKPQPKGVMAPGTGYPGPNIYARTLLALQSGVLEEQEYALHHLVKISHERGDKYAFSSFPPLADALIKKVLEIGSLLLDSHWEIKYVESQGKEDAGLDGLFGSSNMAYEVTRGKKRKLHDTVETEDFARRIDLINEAGLVLRNMVMQEENAEYLSRAPTIRDVLIVLLNLPNNFLVAELQQYGLEIAEQLSRFFPARTDDTVFSSLLGFVQSNDRGAILTALRAICRMGSNLGQMCRMQDVPRHVVKRLCEWILVEDEELRSASLDFLYQYTSTPENVERLLQQADLEYLVQQLCRMLLHGARSDDKKENVRSPKPKSSDPAGEIPIPTISNDLIEQLLVYDEPERSSQWLRACFEDDPAGEITQIALWQAYQVPFAKYGNQRPLLPAKDFITNVSNTFSSASAQVLSSPTTRFVIKGIKPRLSPVDPKGRTYLRCLWQVTHESKEENGSGKMGECGEFALWPRGLWEHIMDKHLGVPKESGENGNNNGTRYDVSALSERRATCRWANCKRFDKEGIENPFTIGMHVKTHLPDGSDRSQMRAKHNKTTKQREEENGKLRSWPTHNTAIDERNDAAGLPLSSVLVLRNLARNIPRMPSEMAKAERDTQVDEEGRTVADGVNGDAVLNGTAGGGGEQRAKTERGRDSLLARCFAPVKERLFFVMAYNQSLSGYLPELMRMLDVGGV